MNEAIRIWRSPESAFGRTLRISKLQNEETFTAIDAYSDDELERISNSGFNAIWIHGNLNHVAQSGVFPELGKDAEIHQKRMNALVERAGRHGLKVFMYCQPPRAINAEDPFWKNNSDVAGQIEPFTDEAGQEFHFRCLCSSTEKVKEHLRRGAKSLAENVPGLGGLIMITASEYPAHCWSRRGRVMGADGSFSDAKLDCPRCSKRKPAEVVSEVIKLVRDGIRDVNKNWKIIAWNWSWSFYMPPPCAEIIKALPKDVILLVDFERGGHKMIAGKRRWIDEYSLSYAGPSEQFQESLKVARDSGLEVMAKLQFGTTHELATVPNIPVLGNVFAKADAVRRMGLAGFMGCWNFGNMVTANTAGFNAFLSGKLSENKEQALSAFAAEYFPSCDASAVTKAWLKFGEAMDSYPFCIPYLYSGPTNFAFILPTLPGPLSGKPVGRSWLLDERGDDMAAALGDYSVDELASCFEEMTALWEDGLSVMRQALSSCAHLHAKAELNTAVICWHSFRSALNFIKIYRLRREWDKSMIPDYLAIIRDELANLKDLLPIIREDPRFGYHIEAHGYQYDTERLSQRISELDQQINSL